MAVTLDADPDREHHGADERAREIEAVLDAMEHAAPGARAEHLAGVYVLNRPHSLHQLIQSMLLQAVAAVLPPAEAVVTDCRVRDDTMWLVPDLIVAPRVLLAEAKPQLEPGEVSLVVEILSPSTEATDRGAKRAFCQRHRIDYWLVTPTTDGWTPIEHHPYGGGTIPPPAPPNP